LHCHQVLNQSIMPPLGAPFKHCTTSHWALSLSIAMPAIGQSIQALRHQPSGAQFKHCTSSLKALYLSIAQPLGTNLKHRATIGCSIKVSHRHQVLHSSIVPPAIGHSI
jgi:hypothetical protein